VSSRVRPAGVVEDERLQGLVENRDLTLLPRRRPHSPNRRDRHVERPGQCGQLIDGIRWCRERDLVIVAARQDRRGVLRLCREDRPGGGRSNAR
jgi:hypothetical protein